MRRVLRVIGLTLLLMGIWVLLSGKLDAMHLGFGLITAVVLTWYYHPSEKGTVFPIWGMAVFVPWELYQIVISNLRIARLALSPKLDIAPSLTRRAPVVQGDPALTVLGCAITLTPGTLTIDVDNDHILVHSLDRASRLDIEQEIMMNRVRQIFEDNAG